MSLFKFTTEFLVRSDTKEEAEKEVKVELGNDVYESHIICEEITDNKQEVDIDLVKV